HLLPDLGEVGEQGALLIVGEDLGSDGHLDYEVLACSAGAVRARAALAARRPEMLRVAEVDERIEAGDRLEHHVAALAVAAVGTAELDELLAPEADRAGAAGARADVDLGLVEEMHLPRQLRELAGEVNRRFDDVHADCIDKRAAARQKSRHRRFMRPGPGGSPRSCLRAMGDGISMNQLSRAFACLAFLPAFLSPASLTAQAAGDPFSFFEGMTESVGTLKVMMYKPVHTRSVGRGEVERDGS